MTLVDTAVIAFLLLVSAGGYRQGLLRGLTRLAGLLTIGFATAILSIGISSSGGLQAMLLRTLTLFGAVVLIVGVLIWLVNRVFPQEWHQARLNKALGVFPALMQGLVVAALVIGLVHRLALEQETQQYLARGIVTGPLTQPVGIIEQSLAGVR